MERNIEFFFLERKLDEEFSVGDGELSVVVKNCICFLTHKFFSVEGNITKRDTIKKTIIIQIEN